MSLDQGAITMLAEQVAAITAEHHIRPGEPDRAQDHDTCACGVIVEDWDMHWAEIAIAAVHDDIVKKARAEWFRELFGDPVERAKGPFRPDSREEILGRMLDYLKPDELVRCSEMVADRIARGGG